MLSEENGGQQFLDITRAIAHLPFRGIKGFTQSVPVGNIQAHVGQSIRLKRFQRPSPIVAKDPAIDLIGRRSNY